MDSALEQQDGEDREPAGLTHTAVRSDATAAPQRRRKTRASSVATARRAVLTQPSARSSRPAPRRRRMTAAVAAAPDDAVAVDEPPLAMTFTDPALLRPLTPHSAEATALCVHVFLDAVQQHPATGAQGAESSVAAAPSSVSLVSFLRDVVEQLGAACVVLDDTDDDDDDDARGSCWFTSPSVPPHSRRGRRGGAATAQPPTHLVASEHAVLTPDLLYYKALGIPIVTPQWLYDAVALGAFPCVVPEVHAHPTYGDGRGKEEGRDGDDSGVSCVTAGPQPQPRLESLLGAEDGEDGDIGYGAVPHVAHPSASPTQTSPRVVAPPPPPVPARAATLRRLHKEVAEAYVPAGQLARRPFFRPLFADRMFYLHVPPIDLATAHAAKPTWRCASRTGCGTYLGDVTAALAQVAALVRVLGGTVTRNLESTYLDVVLDLTGFYDKLAETEGERPSHEPDLSTASMLRALRESLSCAYHDALQRVSQLPGGHAGGATGGSVTPSEAGTAAELAVPIVGIPWLVHSVLAREWTATTPFLLPNHVLAAQVAAAHGGGPPCMSAPAPLPTRDAPRPGDASQGAVWSALMAAAAAPHRKRVRGPSAAMKAPGLQPSTQDAAAMLLDQAPLRAPTAAPTDADDALVRTRICYSEEEEEEDEYDDDEVEALLMR